MYVFLVVSLSLSPSRHAILSLCLTTSCRTYEMYEILVMPPRVCVCVLI